MTQVREPGPPAPPAPSPSPSGPAAPPSAARRPPVRPGPARPAPLPIEFWRSALGKKWVMAVSGIILLGFVLVHMIGNLKVYLGAESLDRYAEWLRELGEPALPRTVLLWIARAVLAGAFVAHIVAAAQLTAMNRRARPVGYRSPRDYVAANFASRTMRWTGVIVALFVVFHLLDLTWGTANPEFVRGEVYDNMVASFRRVPVAIAYIAANVALAIHIFHGAWSLFQTLGWNNPRLNPARRWFAATFAAVIGIGNVSMPLLIVTRVVG